MKCDMKVSKLSEENLVEYIFASLVFTESSFFVVVCFSLPIPEGEEAGGVAAAGDPSERFQRGGGEAEGGSRSSRGHRGSGVDQSDATASTVFNTVSLFCFVFCLFVCFLHNKIPGNSYEVISPGV